MGLSKTVDATRFENSSQPNQCSQNHLAMQPVDQEGIARVWPNRKKGDP